MEIKRITEQDILRYERSSHIGADHYIRCFIQEEDFDAFKAEVYKLAEEAIALAIRNGCAIDLGDLSDEEWSAYPEKYATRIVAEIKAKVEGGQDGTSRK